MTRLKMNESALEAKGGGEASRKGLVLGLSGPSVKCEVTGFNQCIKLSQEVAVDVRLYTSRLYRGCPQHSDTGTTTTYKCKYTYIPSVIQQPSWLTCKWQVHLNSAWDFCHFTIVNHEVTLIHFNLESIYIYTHVIRKHSCLGCVCPRE